MKIFILFCLVLIPTAYAGVWIPNSIQVSHEGIFYFDMPFPVPANMVSNTSELGFSRIEGEGGVNFKRVMAISGKDLDFNLVEYSPGFILPPENQAGYHVLENSKKRPRINLENSGLFDPGFLVKRFSPSLVGIKDLPEINEIPVKIEDFGKWRPGDTFSFRKTSNLSVNIAYAAKTFYEYGVVGSISATWDILVSFISSNKNLVVKVSYKKLPGSTHLFDKGSFNENVNLFKLWGGYETFTFIFDLSNSKVAEPLKIINFNGTEQTVERANALMAYQEALKGNLVIANLLSQRKVYGVRKIFEEEEESILKNQNVFGGLKVSWKFDPSFKLGTSLFSAKSKTFQGNLFLENIAGFYSQEMPRSSDQKKIKIFANYLQQIIYLGQGAGNSERRFGASFKMIKYLKEMERVKFLDQLQSSLFKIGFTGDLLSKKISVSKVENLEMDLDVALSNVALDVLMNLPEEYPENVLVNEANESLINFFKTSGNIDQELCEDYGAKNIGQCMFLAKTKTLQAMTTAYRALQKMKTTRNEKNYSEFIKSFGDFGRGLIENRFTLKTFLKLIRFHLSPDAEKNSQERMVMDNGKLIKAPFEIRIQIKGSNIAPFSNVMRSDFND